MSTCSHDCYCSVNCYKRYDGPLSKLNNAPKYPKDLKTVYTKDYIPNKFSSTRTIEKANAGNGASNMDGVQTPRKFKALPNNFDTNYHKDYVPKHFVDTHADE